MFRRRPSPSSRIKQTVKNVDTANLAKVFDAAFYKRVSGLTDASNDDALAHYLSVGWKQGLDPSPDFSGNLYLAANPDVAQANVNPLYHYVNYGRAEKRERAPERSMVVTLTRNDCDVLSGFAYSVGWPAEHFDVVVQIEGVTYATLRNDGRRDDLAELGLTTGHGGFRCGLPLRFFPPGLYEVSVHLPNGTTEMVEVDVPPRRNRIARPVPPGPLAGVAVAVPIYNAAEDVEICIERLAAHTPPEVEIVLIDDGSPDPKIGEILSTLPPDGRFRVVRNKTNLGYTRTANRCLEETAGKDVILLNSDARVTPYWVEGLQRAAYSRPNVATATAMSDRAGAFSAPSRDGDNPLPPGQTEAGYAQMFRRFSLRLYPEVPTGNGFCFYIRREAIAALGNFDAEAFPRGYGEENDFCMRAARAGWINVIDDTTYVFHERTKSFGASKSENYEAGRKVIEARYPEYTAAIERFSTGSDIAAVRFRARQAEAASGGVQPRALFVLSTRTGGTPQTNADLMSALDDAYEPWVLVCNRHRVELLQPDPSGELQLIRQETLAVPVDPVTHRSADYDEVVRDWLWELGPEVVHIRHLIWHSLSLPSLAAETGATVIYSLHDFYTVCPSLNLLDENVTYCGGVCTTKTPGPCTSKLWRGTKLPRLKDAFVHEWRRLFTEALAPCHALVTTSTSARETVLNALPALPNDRFHVIPHGRDFARFTQLQNLPNQGESLRVLIPGNINDAKGLGVLHDIIALDSLGRIEFHILGLVDGAETRRHPRIIQHGPYKRDEFGSHVQAVAPHVGAVLSVWDETYCHTLTEMWAVGLPVITLDFPNVAERVRRNGAGWVLQGLEPRSLYKQILEIAADTEELVARGQAVRAWQQGQGLVRNRHLMAADYLDIYRGGVERESPSPPRIAVLAAPSPNGNASAWRHPTRMMARTRNAPERPVTYVPVTPEALLAGLDAGAFDGVIIERTNLPEPLVTPFLEAMTKAGLRYILDLDENLLDVPEKADPHGFFTAYAPALRRLIEGAAKVTVATPGLAKCLPGKKGSTDLVRPALSRQIWAGPSAGHKDPFGARALYLGEGHTEGNLDLLLPGFARAHMSRPDLRMTVLSDVPLKSRHDGVHVPDVPEHIADTGRTGIMAWFREEAKNADFALAPLAETPFTDVAPPMRLLEYAALGLPVLASDVPAYRAFVGRSAPAGLRLVRNTPDAWAEALTQIAGEGYARQGAGLALQTWAFAEHGLDERLAEFDALVQREILGK